MCSRCKLEKSPEEFSKSSAKKNGRQAWCKLCLSEVRDLENDKYQANARKKRAQPRGYQKTALYNAAQRSRDTGIPFSLTLKNLPELPENCPCCNIRFIVRGPWRSTPSLDKILPENGYVPENVQWLCRHCNKLKSNASPEELMRLAVFVQKITARLVSRNILSDDALVIDGHEYRHIDWYKAFAEYEK